MKIKIKNLEALRETGVNSYDGNDTPIAIIFKDDNERNWLINILNNMEPKEGERWFVQAPDGYDKNELAEFMEIPVDEVNTKPKKDILP